MAYATRPFGIAQKKNGWKKDLAICWANFDIILMTEVVLTIPNDTKGKALLHFLHQIDFIKIQSEKKSKKDIDFPLSSEDRAELKRRIKNAKEKPESLLDSKQVLTKLEAKLGKKIPIRSSRRK